MGYRRHLTCGDKNAIWAMRCGNTPYKDMADAMERSITAVGNVSVKKEQRLSRIN